MLREANIHFDKFENLHHLGSMSCSFSWFALFTGVTFQGVWVVTEKYSSWSRPKRVLESDPARCETNSPCSEGDLWLLQFGQWTWFCSRSIFHVCTDVSELSIWWFVLKHTFFLKFKRMIGIIWDWRFFFKQSDLFCQTVSWVPSVCTSCVPYLAWRIACTGQQATRTIPLVHTSLTSHVLMLVVQLMGL
jgi:hypothetical protein